MLTNKKRAICIIEYICIQAKLTKSEVQNLYDLAKNKEFNKVAISVLESFGISDFDAEALFIIADGKSSVVEAIFVHELYNEMQSDFKFALFLLKYNN
jgi:hypothetical protein